MAFPNALPHGDIRSIFPGIWLVTGTVSMPGPLPVRFSRNMTIVRQGERLVLINSVRLDDAGLAKLDALGKVTDVMRMAGFHGMDDPFYKDRYGAKVWTVRGQKYAAGFDRKGTARPYFEADAPMDATTPLPISAASLFVFGSNPPEGILVLDREGGILVTGDSLQNWSPPDEYFSGPTKVMMRLMGFIKPHNVGPAWFNNGKPPRSDMRAILDLKFDHLLPSHGFPVIGGAKDKYRPAIDRVTA